MNKTLEETNINMGDGLNLNDDSQKKEDIELDQKSVLIKDNITLSFEPTMEKENGIKSPISESRSRSYNQSHANTHSRIFGDFENAPNKNSKVEIDTLNGQAAISAKKTDGNPLTGEGYEETPVSHRKVPPGGFSSNLW